MFSSGALSAQAKSITAVLLLAGTPQLLAQESPQRTSNGDVVGIINWGTSVADLEKSEHFYHGVLGLESDSGDPRMRLSWYDVIPLLADMYAVHGRLRNFTLQVPGGDMGVEPLNWSEAKGKVLRSRIQDPGVGHLILNTWNIDAMTERFRKGGADIITKGGKPTIVTGPNGRSRVVWVRDPDGSFVQLVQPEPSSTPSGGNGAPAPSYYTGAHAGFTVDNLEKTVRFYKDVLGFEGQVSSFASNREALDAFGLDHGEYRTATLRKAGSKTELHLVEFRGVDRRQLRRRVADSGALVLRMRVQGIDAVANRLKAAGTIVVSVSGGPTPPAVARGFMVEGPDNIFIQPAEFTPPAEAPRDQPRAP